ncbi:hypothetical protein L210DRAFT_845787, partial [Boletus edulis BED1]
YSRLLNQEVIVINSEKVARTSSSYNYSDRPAIICMTDDFFGWSFNHTATSGVCTGDSFLRP